MLAAAGGSQLGYEVKDSSQQKLLEVPHDWRSEVILQNALGVNPPYLRVYPEFPSGHKLGRVLGIDPVNVAGGEYGFKTGEDAPFSEPSDALEYFCPYGISPIFNLYNPHETKKAQPCFSIHQNKISVTPFKPSKAADADLIGKMARGQATVRYISIGPIEDPVAWKSIDDWPSPILLEQAKALK